eukprot:4340959-Amphidinium_carterae.1
MVRGIAYDADYHNLSKATPTKAATNNQQQTTNHQPPTPNNQQPTTQLDSQPLRCKIAVVLWSVVQ